MKHLSRLILAIFDLCDGASPHRHIPTITTDVSFFFFFHFAHAYRLLVACCLLLLYFLLLVLLGKRGNPPPPLQLKECYKTLLLPPAP